MKISTKTIVTSGMFTAVLSVLSIITIPMPSGVPLTLQTFAMALCGYVLGYKKGTASVLIYILLGVLGVPVFAGMKGGPAVLFGYTGGFIWGFLFIALLCGASARQHRLALRLVCGIAGLAVCHLLGVLQFAVISGNTVPQSFLLVSLPYMIKDVISVTGACLAAVPVRKALRNMLTEEIHAAV